MEAVFGGAMLLFGLFVLVVFGLIFAAIIGGTLFWVWIYNRTMRELTKPRPNSIGQGQGPQPIEGSTGSVLDTPTQTGDNPRR